MVQSNFPVTLETYPALIMPVAFGRWPGVTRDEGSAVDLGRCVSRDELLHPPLRGKFAQSIECLKRRSAAKARAEGHGRLLRNTVRIEKQTVPTDGSPTSFATPSLRGPWQCEWVSSPPCQGAQTRIHRVFLEPRLDRFS
jgi:hypothetical protein